MKGLTKRRWQVLDAIQNGHHRPCDIAKHLNISRSWAGHQCLVLSYLKVIKQVGKRWYLDVKIRPDRGITPKISKCEAFYQEGFKKWSSQ